MQELIDTINEAIEAAKSQPRTREMSIVITHLETALLWAEHAERLDDDEQPQK